MKPRSVGDDEQYLSPGETARMFGVDPKTVTRWAREGKLPYIRTMGGHRRYSRSVVLKMIEEWNKA